MKHQKVASRKERINFEDLVQRDKVTKSSGSNINSQRVGSTQPYQSNINFNNNQNGITLNSNQTQNFNSNNMGVIQQNLNSNITRNVMPSYQNEKMGASNLSKRDKIWKERRNKKLNSESSNRVGNSSSNNQMIQNTKIATPYNPVETNQLITMNSKGRDSNFTPNLNAHTYNEVYRTAGQIYTPQNKIDYLNPMMNTTSINNNERIIPTPMSVNSNNQYTNFRQNTNNTYNSIDNKTPNSAYLNQQFNNKDFATNNARSNPIAYAVTPNNIPNGTIPNHRQGNQGQYNTTINYPINTPSNTMPNQYNTASTPSYQVPYNNSSNRTPYTGNTNAPQMPMQMQFNRTTQPQIINNATPNYNSNYPVRNIISQTPVSISNNQYNCSKPSSSQSHKPFVNENISFRNTNNTTPGNIVDNSRNYSAHLGRENNKFIFDKKNVIY